MRNSLHFSTGNDEHETPDDLYDELNKEFRFTRDVCASAKNAKHKKYWTKEDNCLTKCWRGRVWMNPPYSDLERACPKNRSRCRKKICEKRGYHIDEDKPGVYDFVRKASTEVDKGRCELVVCLLASRTDTEWWHNFVWFRSVNRLYRDVEVRFIKGRLKFKGCKDPAPFPSVIVIFRRT